MSEDFSSIQEKVKIVQLPLPISFISNEIAGVKEILESWKRQYNKQLEGIMVKYSNVSLISRENSINGVKNVSRMVVKAKFYVFCPKAGDIVKGRINRISQEHVGCLLHDTINAAINLSEYCPDELKKFVRLDRDILFEITHFDCHKKEISVKGKVTPHCLELMNALIPVVAEEDLTSLTFLNQNIITRYDFDDNVAPVAALNDIPVAAQDVTSTTISEKSKKRKRDSSISDDSERKKKKKRKKDKSEAHSANNSDLSVSNFVNENLSNGIIPVKQENGMESEDDKNLEYNDFTVADDHEKNDKELSHTVNCSTNKSNSLKNKKRKKDKKNGKSSKIGKSKKCKLVASGTVLKADKKKPHKKKHSKKDGSKKKKEKSKKDAKQKKTKHKNIDLKNVEIKSEAQ